MFSDSDPQFDDFARREPYFAILTSPRFLNANRTPADEREFFASGETLVAWMLRVIDAGLSPGFSPVSTLEYGCGMGRLALAFARHPGSVTAIDASLAMLDHARREAERAGVDHIEFDSPLGLFSSTRKFDLVVCYHVLQRIRPADGAELVHLLLSRVGPSGVAVLQFPYRSNSSPAVAATRWMRARVPGANALANTLRGKSARDPFIPTHLYRLPRMLQLVDALGFKATHVVLEDDDGLGSAVVLAQRHQRSARALQRSAATSADADAVDMTHSDSFSAVSDADLDSYNKTAEVYYASLANWDHHLAKPFSQPNEAPTLLANVTTVLQALRLSAGLTVLDFGAGTGWLSRALTQLGCRVVLLDVSPTALAIARDLYRRNPPAGSPPAPQFLAFDGRRIDLPDGSVDRVVCFDAFHHAPDPGAMIREFGRILKPGGRAVFAEPGPRHSEAPRSQFETRTYGVVENDVDVHAIWRVARTCGFVDLKMSVFHEPEHLVSLAAYEQLLAGGAAQDDWLAATRLFLHHVRNFVLVKAGDTGADSRTAHGLSCGLRATVAGPAAAGQPSAVDVSVTNTGTAVWLSAGASPGGVSVGAHLYDSGGTLIDFEWHRQPLTSPPREVVPGETINVRLALPGLAAGGYAIEIDCVADGVTWFALVGSAPVRMAIDIARV